MNSFIKFLGVLLMLAGVVILGYFVANSSNNNTLLAVSGAFVFFGLIGYIVINKFVD
jgi:hypothetical protein